MTALGDRAVGVDENFVLGGDFEDFGCIATCEFFSRLSGVFHFLGRVVECIALHGVELAGFVFLVEVDVVVECHEVIISVVGSRFGEFGLVD